MNVITDFFAKYGPDLLEGTKTTLQVTAVGLGLGILFGLPASLVRVYGKGWIGKIVLGYIEFFRGTPVLVQLFVVYYGLPDLGITLSRLTAAYITLGLNSGAYQAEYFRGAIQAIGRGQMLAARAIGMNQMKAVRYIILPQALRLVIPAWSNEVIGLLKATSVVFLIAVPDLMAKAKILSARYFTPIETYVVVAIVYIFLVTILSYIMNLIERRIDTPGLIHDLDVR